MAQQWVSPYSFALNSILSLGFFFSAGEDYFPMETEVTFSPSETTQTVSIPLVNDDILESREWFLVGLSLPSDQAGVLLGPPVESNITIEDDDCKYNIMAIQKNERYIEIHNILSLS